VLGDADLTGGQLVPRGVVPKVRRDAARQPKPATDVVAVLAAESVERPPQRRDTGRVALGEARRQAVQEQVARHGRL
jgi:hypothetical protein